MATIIQESKAGWLTIFKAGSRAIYRKFTRLFVAPISKIDELHREKQASLLAFILLLICVIQGAGLLETLFVTGSVSSLLLVGLSINILAYFLSRSHFYSYAVFIWAVNNTAVTYFSFVAEANGVAAEANVVAVREGLMFLVFSMLLPALVSDFRTIIPVGLINIILIALIPQLNLPGIDSLHDVDKPLIFNLAAIILLNSVLYYRDYISKIQKQVFYERDDEIRMLLNSTAEAIFGLDRDGRCTFVNRACHELLGYNNRSELLGENMFNLLKPEIMSQQSFVNLNDTSGEELHSDFELFRRSDGGRLEVEFHAYPIRKRQRVEGAVVTFWDISERKKAKDKLRESQSRLQKAQRIAKLGNWEWDIITGELFWSDEIFTIFGLNPKEFSATYDSFLSAIYLDDREAVMAAVNNAIENSTPYEIEHRIMRPDGTIRFVYEQGEVYRDEASGKPLKMLGTVLDITRRKEAELKLMSRTSEVEALNRDLEQLVEAEVKKSREKDHILIQQSRLAAMGEMIGHIAHQWRQPLNALSLLFSNLKLLFDRGALDADEFNQAYSRSSKYIQKMSSTIDDFRDFFVRDKKKSHFYAYDLIESTLELVRATFEHSGIEIERDLDNTVECFGLPNELSQVLLNILNNARDAIVEQKISPGRVWIDLKRNDSGLRLAITDNGGGVPSEIMNKIFDPYFSTKEEKQGTGIGLYMSKTIIEEHMGGRIAAENVSGGARFTITMPWGSCSEDGNG